MIIQILKALMVLPGTDSSIIAPVTFGAIHFITYNENEARLSSAYPRIQKSFARPTPPRNERIFRTKQEKQLYIPSTHPQQHLIKKNVIVYFAFSTLRNIFGFHQKVKILPIFLHLLLGIGDPPPTHFPNSQNSVFSPRNERNQMNFR